MNYRKNKEITLGEEARLKIKKGVDKACNAVRPTLGAVGMTALIEFEGLDPVECDDGVTILKNLEFKDRYENMGVQLLKKAAIRTSVEGGDGTATTTVLTQALTHEAFKEIRDDSSKIREVRERLQKGLNTARTALKTISREVKEEDIEKIAQISSLDQEAAKVIAEVIKEVGVDGVVTVERSAQKGFSAEIVKGIKFGKGMIVDAFINTPEKDSYEASDVNVVLVDRVISTNEQILPVLNAAQQKGGKVLLISDNIQGLALVTSVVNTQNKVIDMVAVTNPYTGTRGKEFLEDIATMTGAKVISESNGVQIEKIKDISEYMGKATKVLCNKDTTTIVGGVGNEDRIREKVATLKAAIESTVSEYQRGMLEDRLASLTGGIGIIYVNAYTDMEFNAKKYKFENAVNATQAALQEGIVAGGGTALKHIAKEFVDEPIFYNAFVAPLDQMAVNAGMNPHEVKMMTEEYGIGVNFKTKQQVDMFKEGIVDATKVTRLAIESAVAIATSLIGIESAIVKDDNGEETSE